MSARLQLLPNIPAAAEPVRGTRRYRPPESRLQLVADPLPAFPSLRPPQTPTLDKMLAEEKARLLARPRKLHDFITEDVFDVGLMRKVKKTWCLNCQRPKGVDGVTIRSECTGTRNERLAAPWL